MRSASVTYAPATTRAVLARFGVSLEASVSKERIKLSPHELPGEVEWRVDLLHWYVQKLVFDLIWLPMEEQPAYLGRLQDVLVTDCQLHHLEAQLVAELADSSLKSLEGRLRQNAQGQRRLLERMHTSWDVLQDRYTSLVLSSVRR